MLYSFFFPVNEAVRKQMTGYLYWRGRFFVFVFLLIGLEHLRFEL
jgi:hypothetical protein